MPFGNKSKLKSFNCRRCGNNFFAYEEKRGTKTFCSLRCWHDSNISAHEGKIIPAGDGYLRIHYNGKLKSQHVFIAEKALGKKLPKGAEVHHINGNKMDNSSTNLVICEDRNFHRLLHTRQKVIEWGGNPNTDKICFHCSHVWPKTRFYHNRTTGDGLANRCRDCESARGKKARKKAKEVGLCLGDH